MNAAKSGLSIDDCRLLVFVIRCARLIGLIQTLLPFRLLPKDQRIPPQLLKRLIVESKKVVPTGTRSARKIPRSLSAIGTEFFYALTAIRLSNAEIWRAGYLGLADAIDELYPVLIDLGRKRSDKKRRRNEKTPTVAS